MRKSFVQYVLLGTIIIACKPTETPILYGDISGIVKDDANGEAIKNAQVSITTNEGQVNQILTPETGLYVFKRLDAGNYKLIAEHTEFETSNQTINVLAGEVSNFDFSLRRSQGQLRITPSLIEFVNGQDQKTVLIENINKTGSINFSISVNKDSESWLKVDKSNGSISNSNVFQLTVFVIRTGLKIGTYSGDIIVNAGESSARVTVNLNISNPDSPSVSILKPVNITKSSAEVQGTLLSLGGSEVVERGHLWSTSENPNLNNNLGKTSKGPGGLGSFTSVISGLEQDSKYYVRSYATNGIGTGFSPVESFETKTQTSSPAVSINSVSEVTKESAKIIAIINNDGGSNVKSSGFVWSEQENPSLNDNSVKVSASVGKEYTTMLKGLKPGTEYYVSAFAENEIGISYSIPFEFLTEKDIQPVVLQTGTASDINENSVEIQGNIKSFGSNIVTKYGFCWSTKYENPVITRDKFVDFGKPQNTGIVNHTLNNLTKGINHYVRMYAEVEDGTVFYGNSNSFKTIEEGLIAYYPLNGDAKDYSGNVSTDFWDDSSMDGVTTSSFFVDRHQNNKTSIDLSDGIFKIGRKSVGRYLNDYSMGFWIKVDESNFIGESKILFSKTATFYPCDHSWWAGYYAAFEPEEGMLNLNLINNFKSVTEKLPLIKFENISDDWHHFFLVKHRDDLTIYLDGLRINQTSTKLEIYGTRTNSYTTGDSEGSFTLGDYSDRSNNCNISKPKATSIDEIRFYNYSLTPQEVSNIYNR